MTFEQAFISKKLQELIGYIDELVALLKIPDEEILIDSGKLHIGERPLQLIVDTMIDVNQHYIRELKLQWKIMSENRENSVRNHFYRCFALENAK